jgi:hypothetical protein
LNDFTDLKKRWDGIDCWMDLEEVGSRGEQDDEEEEEL